MKRVLVTLAVDLPIQDEDIQSAATLINMLLGLISHQASLLPIEVLEIKVLNSGEKI